MPTQGTYYLDTSSFATATAIYTDAALTTAASNGWYKTSSNTFRQQTGAPNNPVLSSTFTCECTTFSASTAYSSAPSACYNGVVNQTYFHNGSGSTPVATDVCYSDAGQTFLGNGFYKISATQYISITGGAGVVASVGTFVTGTSFSSSTVQTNSTNACSATINQTYYHDGSSSLPVVNDVCYDNSCMATGGEGSPPNLLANGYYKISSTGTGTYMQISSNTGTVSAVTSCPASTTSYSSSVVGVFNSVCPFNGSNPPANQTYYHDGSGTLPSAGDTCYSDSAGTTTLASGYYYLTGTGNGNREYIQLDNNGEVLFSYPQLC